MKLKSLLMCTSVAVVAIGTGVASAQSDRGSPGGGGGGGGGAPTEMMPPAGGGDGNAPPAQRMEEPGAGGAGLERGASTPGQDRQSRGLSEGQSPDRPAKKAGDTAKSDKSDKSGKSDEDARDGSASTGASEGESGRDTPKAADKSEKRSKQTGDRAAGDDASSGASDGAEGKDRQPSGSVTQLSGEKRTKVQSAFRSHRSEAVVRDIDIDVSIGVAVPRTVTLYDVPGDVVVLAPEYRRYKYFIYEDRVVIVDPVSFAIIDILILA